MEEESSEVKKLFEDTTSQVSSIEVPVYVPALASSENVKKYSDLNKAEDKSYKSIMNYLLLNGLMAMYSQLQSLRASYQDKLRAKQDARIKQDDRLQVDAIVYLTDDENLRRRVILKMYTKGLFKFSEYLQFQMWIKNVYVAYTEAAVKALELATKNLKSAYPAMKRPEFARYRTKLRRYIYALCVTMMGHVTSYNPVKDLEHYLMQLIQEIDVGTRSTIITDVWNKV